ncbi:MAG: phosphonate ABC transporter, permease protein PhnE [Candidatus Eremiobacteraeota bacterium]|nr:phosphonate ABC transporter, permease protein PhnE [Candidatus Eremiobacteraeota bacterium]MBV8223105.1 phosphonate ABC transporter, permease protein PhnE [Candidatus Eremiobacteraeota bacterium]
MATSFALRAPARAPKRMSLPLKIGIGALVVFLIVQAYIVIEAHPEDIITGFSGIVDIVRRGLPPDPRVLLPSLKASLVTIDVAILATFVPIIFSIPLGFMAAHNTTPGRWAYYAARGIIAVCRTVPDIVWALLFVTAVGLGAFPAFLGLAVHSVGVLGRLYAEAIEDVNMEPVHALQVTGANPAQIASQAILPAVLPTMIGLSLYRLDTNVRSSLVLGFVGGGGIGFQIQQALALFEYKQLTMLLIIMCVMIVGIEGLAVFLRKSIS